MPTYPHYCAECREPHDVFCKPSERDDDHECPECALPMERQPTAPHFNTAGKYGMKAIMGDGSKVRVENIKSSRKRSDN